MRFALIASCIFALSYVAVATPLDDYVAIDDGYFSYSYTGQTRSGNGWDAYIWNMTSQKWLTSADVDRSVWRHWLVIVIPHSINMSNNAGLLYITGGGNENPEGYPGSDGEDLLLTAELAVASMTPAAVLYQVPNQPLRFPCDPWHKSRSEDAAIALTWWHFVHTHRSRTGY